MARTIAIVEDDNSIATMYRMKFEADGYKVGTAPNGRLGLELIEKLKPDVILLDLMMPEMNGDEMLAQMRKTEWGKKIPVVVLTNLGEAEVAERVLENNVAGFIVKAQLTPAEVAEKVKQVLSLKW